MLSRHFPKRSAMSARAKSIKHRRASNRRSRMSGQYKTEWDKLFIGGKWTDPSTDQVIEVHSPATGEYVGRVPMAAATDVDTAVATARAAFDTGEWPGTAAPPR